VLSHWKDNQIGLLSLRTTTHTFAAGSPTDHIPRMFQISPLVGADLAKLDQSEVEWFECRCGRNGRHECYGFQSD
jgi:hypothetical protein